MTDENIILHILSDGLNKQNVYFTEMNKLSFICVPACSTISINRESLANYLCSICKKHEKTQINYFSSSVH